MTDPAALGAAPAATWRERFQRKVRDNALHYQRFLQQHRHDAERVAKEMPNIVKAAEMALSEEWAWEAGIVLVEAGWTPAEMQGYLSAWRALAEHALELSRHLSAAGAAGAEEHTAALLDMLGELDRILGDNAAALVRLTEALGLYRRMDCRAGAGRVLAHLSQVHLSNGDLAAADRCCCEAASLLDDGQIAERALLYNNWGIVARRLGRYEEAETHYRRAEALFAASGNRRGQAKVLNNLGSLLYAQRSPQAEAYFCQALDLYRCLGDELHVARTQVNLGALYHEVLGRTEDALYLHLAVEPVFRRLGDRPYQAHARNNIAVFLEALGRWEEAQEAYAQAAELYLAVNHRAQAAAALISLSEVSLTRGQPTAAKMALEQAGALLGSLARIPEDLTARLAAQQARLQT